MNLQKIKSEQICNSIFPVRSFLKDIKSLYFNNSAPHSYEKNNDFLPIQVQFNNLLKQFKTMSIYSKPSFNSFKAIALMIVTLFSTHLVQAQSGAWPIPKGGENLRNPEPKDAASIKNGRTLYVSYCAPCHGNKGKGDGPASASLNPKPADHTSAAVQSESDGTLYYKISEGHGHTAMPPFKSVLSVDQRWAVINYMRTLARK